MPILMNETAIERSCAAYAKEHGCILLKIQGNRGWPDRMLLIPNCMPIFIEFKKEGGVLSPLQQYTLGMLNRLGFRAEVVDSLMLFKHLFGRLMSTKSEESSGLPPAQNPHSSSRQDLAKPVAALLRTS